jgi:hypothetical protein
MARRSVVFVGLVVACLLSVSVGSAGARGKPSRGGGGGGSTPTGYDISYPQCRKPFPSNVLFGIVGVNDGIVYSPNPCLGTGDGASELAWALQYGTPSFYANTADPGPALSTHWPTGQTSPQPCDAAQPDSSACSYDYGWNAAADSFRNAVIAYGELGVAQSPASSPWWLDVETANSWESNTANNTSALQGEVDSLANEGVSSIGFYVSANDWQTITGGVAVFSSYAYWQPGAGDESTARSFCNTVGVTGHPVTLSQYASGRFDADVRC